MTGLLNIFKPQLRRDKHLIAIVFLVSWAATIVANKLPVVIFEAEDECPPRDTCPPKLIRHETDCVKYYECKNGQKQLRFCAAGLYFSKSWRGCVNRQISDCPHSTISTPTISTPTIPTASTPRLDRCINGDLLPHECNCTKFYECVRGRKALRDCGPDWHFEPSTRTCEPGKDCSWSAPCREGERIPHECQCKKYYLCKNRQKVLRECDKGKHFDKKLLECVPGDCEPKRKCEDGDAMKHDCDCEKYYKCNNEEWLLEHCEKDLHFNVAKKKCTSPIDARCDDRIKFPGSCSGSGPSKWPHECDCRLYYQCENRKMKVYSCNWGLYFNKSNQECNVAANVNCTNNWDTWL